MKYVRIIIVCSVLAMLISLPSIMMVPSIMPFLSADVRRAAPQAVVMLREQGIWLVNAAFDHIERNNEDVCFVWNHAYKSRFIDASSSLLTTCVHAEE